MSTHWPGAFAENDVLFQQFINYIKVKLPTLSNQKIYFDHGDATLDAMYPALQKQVDALFKQGYPEQQWQSRFFEGENHSEQAWNKRLHIPLEFIFAKK